MTSYTSPFQTVTAFNFTESQVKKLLDMQDTLNTYIHADWRNQNFNFGLAINDEVMEIHGHLGWKWWKEGYQVGLTKDNLAQVKLEVIDILHFVLSYVYDGWSWVDAIEYINSDMFKNSTLDEILVEIVDNRDNGTYMIEVWAALARYVGLTEHEIIQTYTQKYVLNKFRQDHGYKDGSYVKVWQLGKPGLYDSEDGIKNYWEDNEALAHVVKTIQLDQGDVTDELELYARLEVMYNGRLNK